jgi:hypothetical protein
LISFLGATKQAAEKAFDGTKIPKTIPQGLKPTLILLRLRPD